MLLKVVKEFSVIGSDETHAVGSLVQFDTNTAVMLCDIGNAVPLNESEFWRESGRKNPNEVIVES